MEEVIEEMSTLDRHLPRYYKGFDVDILLQKMNDDELTEEEGHIIDEVQDIYYSIYFEKGEKEWEAWKKAHPGQYITHIHPQRTDKR